jgi:outer membrane protein OmpA-like peptidoglycan-associated protein
MKRKTLVLLTCCLFAGAASFAQNGFSAGLLAGANFSKFHSKDNLPTNISYRSKVGFAGGAYLNFPVGKSVSIQPEVLYSQMGSKLRIDTFASGTAVEFKQKLNYLSIPVLINFNVGKSFALFFGPQVDFLMAGKIKSDVSGSDSYTDDKSSFQKTDFAGTVGFTLFPSSAISLTGRYIHGFKDIDQNHTTGDLGTTYNRGWQATVNFRLFGGKKKTMAVTTETVVMDSDGDGINDNVDKCPNTPGVAKYNGCPIPDSDNDGVNDEEDKCPNTPGLAKYNGCPAPDTDGDGINDENDKCPTVPGVERYQGCPIPDSDNDGVNDEEDNCPHLAGTAANHGCPDIDASTQSKVDMMAKNVSWTNSTGYTISNKSNKSLDQVASMLKADPNLKVTINAHTDNTGDADAKKTLSQNRADAVRDYLVSQGVNTNQITSTGYGGEQPIADNKTAGGRMKNQRVELKLHY